MSFLKEFIRAPHVTGAIAPSSRHLAHVIVEKASIERAQKIVELGPGTGVFTEKIVAAKNPQARFLALEFNPNFAARLQNRFPDVSIVNGCASRLGEHASQHDCQAACSIVSGLPWAIFDEEMQRTILREIHGVLGEDGIFATFAYFGPHWLPGGKSFRRLLRSQFGEVRTSQVVLRNVPPAFVYYCLK